MTRERPSEIERALRNWENAVRHLLIPVDSQVGRTWDDFTTVADYSGDLEARALLFEEMPGDAPAAVLERLSDADAVFMSKTEPDTAKLLQRSGAADGFEPGDEAFEEPWLSRVPTHGVWRRAMEREAERRDARRRANQSLN